ncbi:GNAT family N-acetyltransferase [Planomicrobium sp. CPCC 101110]|nr:GNAT family N-acetyltransferase [Planomicrobium sp. CPCC 101110]
MVFSGIVDLKILQKMGGCNMQKQEKSLLMIMDAKDSAHWNSIIDGFSDKDIYFYFEYIMSSLSLDDGEALLFLFESENGKIAYPAVKRKVTAKTNVELYDITTPYGYGGPLMEVYCNRKCLISEFREAFNEYCSTHCIVSEFVRFHPLLSNHRGFEEEMEIVPLSHTIEINLQQEGNLLDRLPGKNRNMIRKALKNDVEVKKVDIGSYLGEFLSMYYATMDRNRASGFYYFTEEYFKETIKLFGPDLHLFGAFLEGQMISSTLILTKGNFMHYHLSGSAREYQHLGANNVLLYEVAKWGEENGMQRFHLGGGYSGDGDSLFRFKKSFSSSEPLQFCIGKKIHNPNYYHMLVLENDITEDSGFFPLYRSKK